MTSGKMPLILENPMGGDAMQVDLEDVDDLFGDAAALSLPTRPASKRLRQRLDDLRQRGCCQGISWSKGGTIASISPNGQALELRYIQANEKDATFALSEPNIISPWAALPGGPLVHLSWGPINSELAVIDAAGRVLILNFNGNLNRPTLTRKWDSDSIDDAQAIVGTFWLQNLQVTKSRTPPYTPSYAPAVRNGNGNNYNFQMSPILNTGPWHPHPNKSALISITTSGIFKMFWGQNNGKVEETTLELENVTTADDLITHAAVCSDKTNTLMIGMATASKQLRVVQVVVNWNVPKPDGTQNVPAGSQMLNPTLLKRHVAITSWFQPSYSNSHLDASISKITHVEMLPSIHNTSTKEWSPAVILTVRSIIPEQNSPYEQEIQSIIDRWELLPDQQQSLHSAFEQLGARRNSVGSTPPHGSRLRKLDSVVVHKIIIGVTLINFGKVLCIGYNDGSVDYRDRFTMAELYREPNLDRINSILDVGFSQSGEPSCLQMALSPTNFSLVQLCEDGQVKWNSINYTLSDIESITDSQVSALVASFTISTAQAATVNTNIDDILAVARKFASKDAFAIDWVKAMVQMMKITVDYTEDAPHDHLIKNGILQMFLSVSNYLGWRGNFQPRQPWGKLAMLALNLRNIVIMITLSSNTINMNKTTMNPLDEPDVVNALAGCVKWATDLLCWLSDSLFCLFDDAKFMGLLKHTQTVPMMMYLQSQNEIALHLVLCSATRGLLSAVCRRITLLDSFSTRAISWYETREKSNANNNSNTAPDPRATAHAALYTAYQRIRQYTSSSLIKADEFDKLLTGLGTDIRSAYTSALAVLGEQPRANNQSNAPKSDASQEAIARGRQHCELSMLLLQAPPPFFVSVVDRFFNKDLKEFRARSDVAKLYFADYSILEINDGPRTLERRRTRGTRVDLFKRVEISRKASRVSGNNNKSQIAWRVCARCASVMEDLPFINSKPGLSFLLRQQFQCCCGGRMAIMTPEEARHN
ncbi:RNA polymerase II mediator complex subunit Sin4 [Annulohypoxylon maeteangense]|uniref:RNA polymerase II mediator complex subunit Sin4 n=1 Tax=Annulohypoxylon maeteangense TaxID=1927788 RepID=UPI00200881FF|nr:RNA polymerase II mediator complex subunit Sin4 [Annulohypoxylon maeteangense]KAI0889256.1 RNA polymerase II mediator complex subunit Sin4 [Annulohypoxylon maeteangense]